ncbi:biotin--[acetyl-CoA-carboxylase] ligase [Psychroserpens sp. BH13MA-6]
MRIIKLDAIDSTNTFLRQLRSAEVLMDYTVVMANSQTHGRGQMGTKWQSEPSKNLMASVFVDVSWLEIGASFNISMAISLAISDTLKSFQIKDVKVKWPNDILADQKKISGILIENVIKNNQLQGSIIGFGLNVNQMRFQDLPQATSMQLLTGTSFNLDEVLERVLKHLKTYIDPLKNGQFEALKKTYEKRLFRHKKPSTFKGNDGQLFTGIIQGVSDAGHLMVLLEDDIIKTFDLKEVTLLY